MMSIQDEYLWQVLEQKAQQEDEKARPGYQIHEDYLSGIKKICSFGIERAKTIRDTFPLYTLHDESHICNVLRIMGGFWEIVQISSHEMRRLC